MLTPVGSDGSDAQISDLDSELEIEELTPAYLKIKARLYEIDPQLIEPQARKQTRGIKSKGAVSVPAQTSAVQKLLSQLQQLASDALFDEYEAEAQWPAKRNQIAQRQAVSRERESVVLASHQEQGEDATAQRTLSKGLDSAPSVPIESVVGSEDGLDMLGAMFAAVPEPSTTREITLEGSSGPNIVLRDFGKASGVTPRKVLEEAVRSR